MKSHRVIGEIKSLPIKPRVFTQVARYANRPSTRSLCRPSCLIVLPLSIASRKEMKRRASLQRDRTLATGFRDTTQAYDSICTAFSSRTTSFCAPMTEAVRKQIRAPKPGKAKFLLYYLHRYYVQYTFNTVSVKTSQPTIQAKDLVFVVIFDDVIVIGRPSR